MSASAGLDQLRALYRRSLPDATRRSVRKVIRLLTGSKPRAKTTKVAKAVPKAPPQKRNAPAKPQAVSPVLDASPAGIPATIRSFGAGARHLECIEFVKDTLRRENHCIVHRSDFLTAAEQEVWDRHEEWMSAFDSSEAARLFDEGYNDLLWRNHQLNLREQDQLTQMDAQIARVEAKLARQPDAEEKSRLSAALKRLTGNRHRTEKRFATERRQLNPTSKPYLFNERGFLGRGMHPSDPPILLTTQPSFLDVAAAYYGELAKLRIPAAWRVPPFPEGMPLPPRRGAQVWHRDRTDDMILKVFIYHTPIDADNGALEFVPRSGPVDSDWSEAIPVSETTGYPGPGVIESTVPNDKIVRCEGPAGSLAFVDTACFHRGGYATKSHRTLFQGTYLRANPRIPQSPMLVPGMKFEGLTEEQQYALS